MTPGTLTPVWRPLSRDYAGLGEAWVAQSRRPDACSKARTSRWWRMPRVLLLALLAVAGCTLACGPNDTTTRLTFSGSALGPEGDVVRRQLARFAERRPGVRVELHVTPDSADQRHQLYVQWLNARAPTPDVLQLDVIWMAEFAAAGWILPLDAFEPRRRRFLSSHDRGRSLERRALCDTVVRRRRASSTGGPISSTRATLTRRAATLPLRLRESDATRFGLVWQGARYEGLVTVFLEHLGAFGGGILDARGRVIVDDPAAIRALAFMAIAVNAIALSRASALTWQEEQVRFAFQNGESAFMRNWPYAWALMQDEARSRVARRFAVAPFPAGEGGRPPPRLAGGNWPSTPVATSQDAPLNCGVSHRAGADDRACPTGRTTAGTPFVLRQSGTRGGFDDSSRSGSPSARGRRSETRHARL